jgi:hypothetical protein
MYPEYLVAPMREDLTKAGFQDLKSAEEVESVIKGEGTVFVVVNSVCGCAAANARPAAKIASEHAKHPEARSFMLPYPPSSPSMALFKDGKLVHIIERHQIEGRPAQMIADNLISAFEQYC